MPPLSNPDPPIEAFPRAVPFHPAHPSPSRTQLGLERMSAKEVMWWGSRFGIDTPYYAVFLGWGEISPLYGWDALEASGLGDVIILPPGTY